MLLSCILSTTSRRPPTSQQVSRFVSGAQTIDLSYYKYMICYLFLCNNSLDTTVREEANIFCNKRKRKKRLFRAFSFPDPAMTQTRLIGHIPGNWFAYKSHLIVFFNMPFSTIFVLLNCMHKSLLKKTTTNNSLSILDVPRAEKKKNPEIILLIIPVGWFCRIQWLHLSREVKHQQVSEIWH